MMDSSRTNNDVYFADLEFDSPEFAAETFSFAEAWVEFFKDSGLDHRCTRNLYLYCGSDPTQQDASGQFNQDSFNITGENGELLFVSFNDFRNLIQHILNMTVSQPPNMQAKAINDDSESLIAAETFDGIFDYYMNTYKSARLLKQSRLTVEYSLFIDTGYMLCEWDPEGGDPVDGKMTPDGQPVLDERGQPQLNYQGDMYFKARNCWDVFFDPGCENDDEPDWVLVRDQVNKHTYAKQFPEHKDRILNSSSKASDTLTAWRRGMIRPTKTNMIEVFKFYHRPTAAMPMGRHAILLDPQTVLLDGPNPYDCIPLFSVKAGEGIGSIVGYCPGNSLAPVQLSQNVLDSAQMTNYAMFGVQNIAVKDPDQFDVTEIAGAMNILKYSDAPPIPLQLAKQADGIGEFDEKLSRKGETLSGINSVVRGDPDASLKSGKALGIVQAAAVQFNSALAASYAQFLKDVGNFMLQVFRKYATSKRVTQIVGKNQQQQSATWDKDTFGPIDRVAAELVDPAMRTLGYKTDLAMFMAQNNLTETPQEFLTVLTTGQLKPVYRGEQTELNTIHQENSEMLEAAKELKGQIDQMTAQAQGNPALMQQMTMQVEQQAQSLAPPVMRWDNDDLHIMEHKAVACAPAVRRNGAVTQLVMAHITAHEQNKIAKAVKLAVDQAQVQMQTQQALGPMMPMLAPQQPQQGQPGSQQQAPQPQT